MSILLSFLTVSPEDDWVSYASYCYLIIDISTLNWTHARRICQMPGGDLVIIRSAAENTFIFKLVTKQSTVQNWGVWLGFVRQADNKLCWIDDTPMANGYTAWGTGEPNKVNERCGNMFGKGISSCDHLWFARASGPPYLIENGSLSIRENLVMTSPSVRPSVRPYVLSLTP